MIWPWQRIWGIGLAGFVIVCCFTAAFGLLAERLSKTVLTAPMAFIFFGTIMAWSGLLPADTAEVLLHPVAEIALIVLLFLDAAQTNLKELARSHTWPLRMLVLGLPMAILLGTVAAWLIMPGMALVLAALAAAILSPTDAALGQAVVTNPDVPERSRRALTVESGLNDGLALPIILMLASMAAYEMENNAGSWLVFGLKQVALGPVVGIVMGYLGGRALIWAKDHNTTSRAYEGASALALAAGAYTCAGWIGGNGFIAVFVAGLVFGNVVKTRCPFIYEFAEGDGQILTWGAFLMIGIALVPEAITNLSGPMFLLICVSLFIVRPTAIWVSLIGTDAKPLDRLFFGWFGPRGLATALFALLILHELPEEIGASVLHLAVNAVWISALLHGVTAVPFGQIYGRLTQTPDTDQANKTQAREKAS